MAQNVIPDSHANRLIFFKKLKADITTNAVTLKLDPAFLTGITAMLDALITPYQNLVDAEQAVATASAEAASAFAVKEGALHGLINNLKANPYCTAGMREAMGLSPTATPHDPATIKPRIKADAEPGHVRITGSKDYAELYNVYMRLVGTAAWTLVGIRRKKFPFDDQTPLKTPGVPEAREYMARGVIADDEVGQPSDIVQVTFGG